MGDPGTGEGKRGEVGGGGGETGGGGGEAKGGRGEVGEEDRRKNTGKHRSNNR